MHYKFAFSKRIITVPEPATPTVAAPAPMNLAAESISLDTGDVWKLRIAGKSVGCFCDCCTTEL